MCAYSNLEIRFGMQVHGTGGTAEDGGSPAAAPASEQQTEAAAKDPQKVYFCFRCVK